MSGNARPQSSQLVEPLWTISVKRAEPVHEQISTLKKKTTGAGGNFFVKLFPKLFARERKKKSHPPTNLTLIIRRRDLNFFVRGPPPLAVHMEHCRTFAVTP